MCSYVLMTCICKYNDWERSKRRDRTSPLEDSNCSTLGHGVASDIMRHHKNDKICNRKQCNNAGVLQRVKTTQERQGYNDKPVHVSLCSPQLELPDLHKSGDPKLSVNQEADLPRTWRKSFDYAWHKISNNYQVTDCHTEALDGDGRIEYDGQVRICELRKGRKGYMAAVNVSCASCLKI